MELTELEILLIQLIEAYEYRKKVADMVSVFMLKDKQFQNVLAPALTERRLSEEELLQLVEDYIKREHPNEI